LVVVFKDIVTFSLKPQKRSTALRSKTAVITKINAERKSIIK
jgi:hypothetical protein